MNPKLLPSHEMRIFGMILIFGLLVATICGQWKYAGHATLAACALGAVAGEAWHRWRVKSIEADRHP